MASEAPLEVHGHRFEQYARVRGNGHFPENIYVQDIRKSPGYPMGPYTKWIIARWEEFLEVLPVFKPMHLQGTEVHQFKFDVWLAEWEED
jgi:hypothetical protein